MGKQGTPNDSKKSAAGGPAAENQAPKGAPQQHSGAPSSSGGGGGKSTGAKVGCHAVACKDKDVRFNFCEEHFRQFKFGLITKAGDKVLDYERKLEHYQSWVKAQGGRSKVA